MSEDVVFIIGIFLSIILCSGDPDLLDVLINTIMQE